MVSYKGRLGYRCCHVSGRRYDLAHENRLYMTYESHIAKNI
jgi:hypothetical protein